MALRKNRLCWLFYDALNSLVIIVGAVYFTKWLIADVGIPDSVVAATVSSASILFILIGPRFGLSLSDEKTAFNRLLVLTVLVGVLAIGLGVPGLQDHPSKVLITAAIAVFFCLNLVYQLSLVAYNAYLPVIVDGKQIPRYSGFGEGAGHLGSVVGLVVALILLSTDPGGWFSTSTVRLFLVIGPVVLVLCVAAVLGMRNKGGSIPGAKPEGQVRVFRTLLGSKARKGLFPALILMVFLYNNAFVTLQVFASSYLSMTAGWDEMRIGFGILLTLLGAGVGGFLASMLRQRINLGRQLLLGTLVFAVSISGLALAWSDAAFFASLFGGGIGFGFLAAVSRSCIVLLVPELPTGLKFGVYGAVARTSAVFGPLLWAGTLAASSSLGDSSARRVAMGCLAALIWLSFGLVAVSRLAKASAEVNKT